MGNQKKKKKVKTPIEELLKASHWGGFVATLPSEVQRLSLKALDAYDNGNYRRMEQFCDQIFKVEVNDTARESLQFDVFQLLLVNLLMGHGVFKKAVVVINDLIKREEARGEGTLDVSSFAESAGVEGVWRLLGFEHIRRVEQYKFMLADSYRCLGDNEKAAEIYASIYPFTKRTAGACNNYINTLAELGRDEEALALTDGIIERYSKPQEDGKIYQGDASITCRAYSVKMSCALDRGDSSAADKAISDMLSFIVGLDDDVKNGRMFKHNLGGIIIGMGTQTDNELYREAFEKLLDAISSANVYDNERDEYDEFLDLIPSGYRVLERIEYENDDNLHRFIAGMLIDIANHADVLQDAESGFEMDSETAYFKTMGMLSAKWYLLRFCSESSDNLDELKRNIEVIKKEYPYIWDILDKKIDEMIRENTDFEEEMELILAEIHKRSRGRKVSLGQMKAGMEDGYKRTWEQEMGN